MSLVEFYWPGRRDSWGIAGWWTPDEDDATQPESGIVTLTAANGDNSRLTWDDGVVTWDFDTDTLTAAVGFDLGQAPGWAIGYDGTTARLVVRAHGGAITSDEADTGPGTTERNWLSVIVGEASGGFGAGDFGDGTFGGDDPTLGPNGVFELMIGERLLTVAEASDLLVASTAFGGLPYEAWPIWHASGDSTAVPLGDTYAGGRRVETAPDGHGRTKGLGVLRALVTPWPPFAVRLSGTALEATAFLAEDEDDAQAQHEQFAAATEQTLRFA